MSLDPKHYKKEMKPASSPYKRIKASTQKFAEAQKRLLVLDNREAAAYLDMDPNQSISRASRDDDIDVWYRGLQSQPSITDFSIVSIEECEHEHPVPCGDQGCDRCYVLSVVTEFDDYDVPTFSFQPFLTFSRCLNVSSPFAEEERTRPSESKQPGNAEDLRPSPRAMPAKSAKNTGSYLVVDIHETWHKSMETKPVKRAGVEVPQQPVSTYMGKHTHDRKFSDRVLPEDQNLHLEMNRVASNKISVVETELHGSPDRLQDEVDPMSITAQAQDGTVQPTQLNKLDSNTNGDMTAKMFGTQTSNKTNEVDWIPLRVQSPPGAWAKETRRLIRRVSDPRSPSPTCRGSVKLQVEASSASRCHSPEVHPAPQPLGRAPLFGERTRSGGVVRAQDTKNEADGFPRIGYRSRPPLSQSSYSCRSSCAAGDCVECSIMDDMRVRSTSFHR